MAQACRAARVQNTIRCAACAAFVTVRRTLDVATHADVAATAWTRAITMPSLEAEGRAPSPWFRRRDLRQKPDVAQAGINALYHYEVGADERGDRWHRRWRPCKPGEVETAPAEERRQAGVCERSKSRARSISLRQRSARAARGREPAGRLCSACTSRPSSCSAAEHSPKPSTFGRVTVADNASTDRTKALSSASTAACRQQEENLHFLRGAASARAARGGR